MLCIYIHKCTCTCIAMMFFFSGAEACHPQRDTRKLMRQLHICHFLIACSHALIHIRMMVYVSCAKACHPLRAPRKLARQLHISHALYTYIHHIYINDTSCMYKCINI